MNPIRDQSGATLLEVLVAIVVLAIGLLGLAALQMTSLTSGYSAHQRSQATMLAYDISDRMRARPDAALAGAYDNNSTDADRVSWNTAVVEQLGAGASGQVIRNGQAVEIRVTWTDSRGNIKGVAGATQAGSQADSQTFVFRMRL